MFYIYKYALPWEEMQPTPAFLPGEFHGQRSLTGYSPWDCKESGMMVSLTLTYLLHLYICKREKVYFSFF